MKKAIVGLLFLLLQAACSGGLPSTTAPTLPPDATTQVGKVGVLCPTENQQAWQLYNDAVELEEKGDLENAGQLYREAIELDPDFCDAMDNLGLLLRSQGNIEEAILWYKRSIEVLPNNRVAHLNLAFAYEVQGRPTDAIVEYQLLIQIDPDDPEGYYGLGNVYLHQGQLQEAVTELKKAEEVYLEQFSPLVTDARNSLGVSYYMLEECQKAREYFELIYSEMREDPGVNYFLGLCYLCPETENLELAERYLTKAQELGVDIPAETLRKLGK